MKTRLERLHEAAEDLENKRYQQWINTYNFHPEDDRVVEVWCITDTEHSILNTFTEARYNAQDGCWMTPMRKYVSWNVVYWKDKEEK